MENFLLQMLGRKVDIACGESTFIRGEIVSIKDGILHLKDEEDRNVYVAVSKIAAVWEIRESHQRPGLVGGRGQ
ncbi:MAG: hypothetical protein N2Z23_08080 [Pyrinomonadaceae bacterium]|nr:hypothetical protein [Pyrinomonadaceae bacterium]MCX7640383.1 hypothetical protein [Pyrinomonadaceae bacterium]MDW8304811.1 MM0924 family protein [Acidobacteriota bacterium]